VGEPLVRLFLVLASVGLVLLGGEALLRWIERPTRAAPGFVPVERLCHGCERLFELNPSHPAVSEQGTRDRVYAIPKPPGVFRILVLGDSVAFAQQVARSETFADRLEAALDRPARPVEVVNAGVNGYSIYNERHYFEEVGRGFAPDLVLVEFCMNEVVDPLLHWNRRPRFDSVPEAAIPNPAYHAQVAAPRYRAWRSGQRLGRHSRLLGRLGQLLLPEPLRRARERCRATPERPWPTCLTLEDDLGIEVLTDEGSPEWRWLRGHTDRLRDEVAESGALFAVLVFPLAYQMDPGYPHRPQAAWERYCHERGWACLDLLPSLRAGAPARRGDEDPDGYGPLWLDAWHLSPAGHAVAAREIERFLDREGLLPPLPPDTRP
jgi:lysophospholipase L1-like esterase